MKLAVLIALGLCLGSTMARAQEGVLYCTEDDSVGFKQVGENYTNGLFNQTRFTISLKEDHLTLAFNGKPRVYACDTVFGNPKHHACTNGDGFYFSYNEENGRFTQARTYGYTFVNGDTSVLSIGKCTAF